MTLTPARILIPALLVAALALTGCAGGDDADSGGSTSSGAGDAPAAAAEAQDLSSAEEPAKAAAPDDLTGQQQALIRKGSVALRADDVGSAHHEVQKVVDRFAGQVADENTQTDEDGKQTYTRMVLRIPSEDFNAAVDALKNIGELESANTNLDDVTSEVIGVRTRLAVQKRSIARVSVLFQKADSIRDIMAIESELSQRQADLESLEQQSVYLANQTSLSTIVVRIDQIPETKEPAAKDEADAGFITGLQAGWGSLTAVAVGAATVAGALLPWLVVLGLLAVPTVLLVRSLRRRRTA